MHETQLLFSSYCRINQANDLLCVELSSFLLQAESLCNVKVEMLLDVGAQNFLATSFIGTNQICIITFII